MQHLRALECFREKWTPVFRSETPQNKNLIYEKTDLHHGPSKSTYWPINVSGFLIRLFVAITIAASFLLISVPANAQIQAKLEARLEQGYGRIIFDFSRFPKYKQALSSSIFILSFEEPVKVDLRRVTQKLAKYIGVARVDPDGRAVRFALTNIYKVNLIEAGNKLFVDILPANWVGLPPSLPKEVIAELARQAEEAEKKLREEERQRRLAENPNVLKIRIGRYPTFSRIAFEWNKFVRTNLSRNGKKIVLQFEEVAHADLSHLKADPPPYLQKVEHRFLEDGKKGMEIEFTINPEANVRGFREGKTYIVDLTGPNSDLEIAAEKASDTIKKIQKRIVKPTDDKGKEENIQLAGQQLSEKIKKKLKASPNEVLLTDKTDLNPSGLQPEAFGDWETSASSNDVQPMNLPSSKGMVALPKKGDAEKKASPPEKTKKQKKGKQNKHTTKKNGKIYADVMKTEQSLKLIFPFSEPVAAAVFRRARTIWVVFDSHTSIDAKEIKKKAGNIVKDVGVEQLGHVQVVRMKLTKPWLAYASQQNTAWIINIGDMIAADSKILSLKRGIRSDKKSVVTIAYKEPGRVHWLTDPELGDRLAVVTAYGPSRSVIKPQKFVEFMALATAHGVVVKPHTDDLAVRIRVDEIMITRSEGLTLSAGSAHQYKPGRKSLDRGMKVQHGFIDFQKWQQGGIARFASRAGELERAIAGAEKAKRNGLRLELARLYMSHQLAPEALGIIRQIVLSDPGAASDPALNILRGAANALMGRLDEARKDLYVHALANDKHASLWRGILELRNKNWKEALSQFKDSLHVLHNYPFDIQARFRLLAAKAAIEVRDLARTADELDALPRINLTDAMNAQSELLRGRYLDAIGRVDDAVESYTRAISSEIETVAAEAELKKISLLLRSGRIKPDDAIKVLERLSVVWRGDEIELGTLRQLAKLYVAKGKYRHAFDIMKNAVLAFPKDRLALLIQDEMKEVFGDLFLHGKGNRMAPVAALSLYYDYRELTPIGRLGDQMIRRLADRLISVDLLDQAAELLDHQVTKRLKGAARALVATRLAMVHLMNRKPALALRAIRHTRQPDLPEEIRQRRDLLEARALGEMGRVEGAIDILNGMKGEQIERLKADALWNAQKWRKAGEQFERILGSRWQDGGVLKEEERFDVLRAAISYSLADDQFALDRLRKKFYPKMIKSPDAESFVVVTKPIKVRGKAFRDLAKEIASVDTLDAFMKKFRQRYDRTSQPKGKPSKTSANEPVEPRA